MLKNARTEYQDEAEEIATYRAIEALAKAVGDKETAKLAREIGREEKRMADFLVGIIDQLALDVVHDEVPVSEIGAPAAARRTAVSRPRRQARARSAEPHARAPRPSPPRRREGQARRRRRAKAKPAPAARQAAASPDAGPVAGGLARRRRPTDASAQR